MCDVKSHVAGFVAVCCAAAAVAIAEPVPVWLFDRHRSICFGSLCNVQRVSDAVMMFLNELNPPVTVSYTSLLSWFQNLHLPRRFLWHWDDGNPKSVEG